MKKTLLPLVSLLLMACSHAPVEKKVVQFPYASELLGKIQMESTRAPASVSMEAKEEKSTRRVYFSALYHQYMTLGSYYQKGPEIESCPAFHHDKLEAEEHTVAKLARITASRIDEEGKDYFPELAFSGKHSMRGYYEDMRAELLTLCDEGVSDNFFKFDNLVTHYAGKKSFHLKPGAMESVLKIPVFANFYLVKMMSAQSGFDSTYPEETKFIEMTQTHWFEKYVRAASMKRSNFVKNKLVRR